MATRTASKFASEGAARWLDAASMEPNNATAAAARSALVDGQMHYSIHERQQVYMLLAREILLCDVAIGQPLASVSLDRTDYSAKPTADEDAQLREAFNSSATQLSQLIAAGEDANPHFCKYLD